MELEKINSTDSRVESAKKINAAIDTIKTTADMDLSNLSEEGKAKFVNTSGDTMTGDMKIKKSDIYLIFENTAIDNSTNSSSFQNIGAIFIKDKNAKVTGYIQNSATQQDYYKTAIGARRIINGVEKTSALEVAVDSSGNNLFAFPQCITKPTTTSSARGNKVAVVTQNYLNGTSWYRVWSDGFIEQGGSFTSSGSDQAVTLLRSFSDTNYTVNLTLHLGGGSPNINIYCKSKATNKITFYMEQANRGAMWEARGY
jgi:hypothetical protein